MEGFWSRCAGDGLVSLRSSCVCFLGTQGGVLIKCGTHSRPGAGLDGRGSSKTIILPDLLMPLGGVPLKGPSRVFTQPPVARTASGSSRDTAAQATGPQSNPGPEAMPVNAVAVKTGQSQLISLCSDCKIKKGSRIYEEDNRHSKHEEKIQKYSINQVFTGKKCPLGIPLK